MFTILKTLENIEIFANIKSRLNSKISFGVGFLISKLHKKI